MEKAKNKLVDLSEDSELIGMYDKEIVDRKVRNTMIKSAQMEGKKLGMEEGINEGINRVVINMLKENIAIDLIQKYSGLETDVIEELKSKLN